MKTITLKLPEELLAETGGYAKELRISRAEYVREAIRSMNRTMGAKRRAERMAAASRKVRDQSMRVNAEFAAIERAPDA
jgi:metal-responsive CopG/Arc/MetJ family transcriptional regulator